MNRSTTMIALTTAAMLMATASAHASLITTIDPAGGEQDGVEVVPATKVSNGVISLKDMQAYIDHFGDTSIAGVIDLNGTGGGANVTEAGTSFVIHSTATVRTNRTDQPAVLATSGTHHGFQESDATWTFIAPAGRRVTHFGLVALDWVDASTGMTITATYSDGSTATLTFDDAPATQDAWLGFAAKGFGSITQVAVNVEDGGNWTAFDDTAFVTQARHTRAYVYDTSSRLGAAAPSTDAWTGSDLVNWVTANSPGGLRYLRNNNGGDDTITRVNNSAFTFDIPDHARRIAFEVDARVSSGTSNFMEVGLSEGSGNPLFAIGFDFNNNNVLHVRHFNGSGNAFFRTLGSAIPGGDFDGHFLLDIDPLANAGDGAAWLYLDDVLVVTVANLHLLDPSAPALSDLNALWVRTTSQFVGPGNFAITVTIPAPAALPAGLAMLTLAAMRRRRR